jgi:hypothetical protein
MSDQPRETCENCGHPYSTEPPMEPLPFDRQPGAWGVIRTAIVFTLNKTKGCAHDDEVNKLYKDYYRTLNGFEAAVIKLYDDRKES